MKGSAKLLERAILFAVKAHKGQRRKGDGRPYIMHPMAVMSTLYSIKKSKNIYIMAAAAILHDTVEDCGISIKKITKKFGLSVAGLVQELTLNKEKYKTIGKTEYLCQEVLEMSNYALCIKLCDRLDNVRDLETMTEEFRLKYIVETERILNVLMKERKLTYTHDRLVQMLKLEIRKHSDRD